MSIKVFVNVRDRDGNGTSSPLIPVNFFDDITINLKYDSVASTFKMGLLFDPTDKLHAELACVSHIHECEIWYVDPEGWEKKILTGFMLSQGFAVTSKPELAYVGGYSRAGLLGDCEIPISCAPESNGLSYTDIVTKVLNAMNMVTAQPAGVDIRPATKNNPIKFAIQTTRAKEKFTDVDKKSDNSDSASLQKIFNEVKKRTQTNLGKTTTADAENALGYLQRIAVQKRMVLSHDEDGHLVVGVPKTHGEPLFVVDSTNRGTLGITDMRLVYDGQKIHSHITVIRNQTDSAGGNAAEKTIENPLCPIVYRPRVVSLTFGNDVTIDQAARNELGNDLRAVGLKITLDRWAINGRLLQPNTVVMVKEPRLYLYNSTKWFIESIDFTKNTKDDTAVLNCVLPYVYNDETPVNPFVDPGKNSALK